MFWLYALAFASWAGVFLYMLPAVWSLYVKQGRWGDPARLNVLLIAALIMGFLGRRIAFGHFDTDQPIIGLLVASTGVAAFTAFTARTYGRGRHV
jgi:hypothetical protein